MLKCPGIHEVFMRGFAGDSLNTYNARAGNYLLREAPRVSKLIVLTWSWL